ncbi:hypothetical protein [Burkholderia ubonensis]|uniref:hypothetical protein n=1 Tax=Burkholderia ubonensis TaxID=101571 RepID=UPI0012F8F91C|nr:hypothetical protein [Burkholderia ubonensis]
MTRGNQHTPRDVCRYDRPDGLKASEPADRIDVSRPVMTRTIQGMVNGGTRACRDLRRSTGSPPVTP